MGKTTKLLRIAVSTKDMDAPFVQELLAKGHTVEGLAHNYDLILLPEACRFLSGMEFMLDSVIKGARKLRYGKEKL